MNHAHAVELGLAATGETVGAALVELSAVILEQYADAEAQHDPPRLSLDARPDIVRRHARARRRILQREPPEGDRITLAAGAYDLGQLPSSCRATTTS